MTESKHNPFAKPFYEALPKDGLQDKTLKSGGISEKGANVTNVDWFSINPEILEDDAKLLSFVENLLGLSEGALDKKETYEIINRYVGDSVVFIRGYLQVPVPRQFNDLRINNKNELLKFLRNTKTLGKKDKLTRSPFYCAIAIVSLAFAEYDKKEMKSFIGQGEYLFDQLQEVGFFTELEHSEDSESASEFDNVSIGLPGESRSIIARVDRREKSSVSIIGKFLRVPEYDIRKVIKDGIGIRIVVNHEADIKPIVFKLLGILDDNFSAEEIKFSQKGLDLFNAEEIALMKDDGVGIDSAPSDVSSSQFSIVKIIAKIELPDGGESDGFFRDQGVEFQMVLSENRNERGSSDEDIHFARKQLSIFSRVFGPFTENHLDKICENAHREVEEKGRNISVAKMKKDMIDKYLCRITYPDNRTIRYCSYEHIQRWEKAGILPSGVKIIKPPSLKD